MTGKYARFAAVLALGAAWGTLGTPAFSQTNTPTGTATATFTNTPNPTLTPPCGGAATVLGVTVSTTSPGTSVNTMRAGMFTLSLPATVYSLWLYSNNPGFLAETGVYSGSTGSIGSLLVSSAAQTIYSGWNGFSVTPTYLPAGNYWLAYVYNSSGYRVYQTTSAIANTLAFTSNPVTFSAGMPAAMPNPAYDSATPYAYDSIYAVYCYAPTATPTSTRSATSTPTDTITSTPTATGTLFTATPTSTPTSTPTVTSTLTATSSPTASPNPSLTPDCGAAAGLFGNTNTAGGPATATSYGIRACVYNLPVTGKVETISLYCLSQSAGTTAVVGIYSSQSVSLMGSLIAQSNSAEPRVMTAGWNAFSIPATVLSPGNYWLSYIFSGPKGYVLDYQTSPSPVTNTLAWATTQVTSWTFDPSAASYPVSYNTGMDIYDPIFASYCPAVAETPTNTATLTPSATVTDSPTVTLTFTATSTPTDSATPTPTGSPTDTATLTSTGTPTDTPAATSTPTATPSSSSTGTATASPSASPTGTATDSPTSSPTFTPSATATPPSSFTPTLTATDTASRTPTSTPTWTASATASFTPTDTPASTATWSATATTSPGFSPTLTETSSPSATPSATPTPLFTASSTPTASSTSSPTASGTPTAASTPTATAVPAATPILYPNPQKGPGPVNLTVDFDKPHDYVTVRIFTTAFRKVYERTDRYVPAGTYRLAVDTSDFGGEKAANGLYYVAVTTPSDRWISKLLILK